MRRDQLLHELESLAQLDSNAAFVYDEALEHATDRDVVDKFEEFRGDHLRHMAQISEEIVRLGGEKPDVKVSLSGLMSEWVASIRGLRRTEGALHSMENAERHYGRHYDDAMTWDVGDDEVASMLRGFDDDERRHLEFIEEKLGKAVRV